MTEPVQPHLARRLVVAALPLLLLPTLTFLGAYVHEGSERGEALLLLALLAHPVVVLAAIALNARGLPWSRRLPLWALSLGGLVLSCGLGGLAHRVAERAWTARNVAPRREALLAFARDPAARARAASSPDGLWILERDTPVVLGHVFDRGAFTAHGAWLVVRPAHGIQPGWGLFVPFADVDPALMPRPDWLVTLEPSGVDGVLRFTCPDGMSGGGGSGFTLSRSYRE